MLAVDGKEAEYMSEKEKDRDQEADKSREKQLKGKGSSKTKDLSHVPCKFFKVGSCTAGSSCPFSHAIHEPGQQKDVCAWFVKGNCKFGHKCALAHILPGQSMAMDRKNKKAAQLAANAGANGGGTSGGGSQPKDNIKSTGSSSSSGTKSRRKDGVGAVSQGPSSATPPVIRNQLLSGSTAPTRISSSSRLPLALPLKASISPSAPAPPLKDTDFASFGYPDEMNKLSSAPAQTKLSNRTEADSHVALSRDGRSDERDTGLSKPQESSPPPFTVPAGMAMSPPQRRMSNNTSDIGLIGSPSRPSSSALGAMSRINGFSPVSSPPKAFISSSPFSAPVPQAVFLPYEKEPSRESKIRSGIATSLGASQTWGTDAPVQRPNAFEGNFGSHSKSVVDEIAVQDEDLEDFLPSSLTDLLTPEERLRRMSRTNSGQPSGPSTTLGMREMPLSGHRSPVDSVHRYSRSVPAPSLLGEIKSIWAENGSGGSPDGGGGFRVGSHGQTSVSGTPGSFRSNGGYGGLSFNEDLPSANVLSPSNASAAFLPGLHHYLSSKGNMQRSGLGRGAPSSLHNSLFAAPSVPNSISSNNIMSAVLNEQVVASSSHNNDLDNRLYVANHASDLYVTSTNQSSGRPIPGGKSATIGEDDRQNTLSPSTRALQAHAPGQSLPQGLAAGYSRIHALPPPPPIPSPAASGVLGSAQANASAGTGGAEWTGGLNVSSDTSAAPVGTAAGLAAMFARPSYAASSRVSSTQSPGSASPHFSPSGGHTGMRNSSARNWHGQGPLSPLSGPVMMGDDEDLFSMDG